MTQDQDERARKLRAQRLRKQIREITGKEPPESEATGEDPGSREKSPRDRIEEKMRELDAERSKRDS